MFFNCRAQLSFCFPILLSDFKLYHFFPLVTKFLHHVISFRIIKGLTHWFHTFLLFIIFIRNKIGVCISLSQNEYITYTKSFLWSILLELFNENSSLLIKSSLQSRFDLNPYFSIMFIWRKPSYIITKTLTKHLSLYS